MTEQRAPYHVEYWNLEIVAASERLNRTLDLLHARFRSLELVCKSRYFAIFGCGLPMPLSEDEKMWLDSLKEQLVIIRYRCKHER